MVRYKSGVDLREGIKLKSFFFKTDVHFIILVIYTHNYLANEVLSRKALR